MIILAIDQGTTSTRALVLENEGRNKGKTTITKVIEHQQIYPQSNWVEHDAEELIQNIYTCIDHSIEAFPNISAIGIDNQGESCLAWHAETKHPISSVIVWQDSRTQDHIEKLKNSGLENRVLEHSGLPLDTYFSASKLAWILQNIPEAQALHNQKKLRLGTTDAFFLDRLSGIFVTDITTASRTSLMNLQTGQWDEELCDLFDVPLDALPDIVPTTGDFGTIKIKGTQLPITTSICDQQASLFGHGCRQTGDAKITFGTGAFALALTGSKLLESPKQGLLPTIAWQLKKPSGDQPINYAIDGGVYNAAAAINWAKSLGLFQSFEQINQFSSHSAIEKDLIFVPALSGLACPHWDRKAAGLWIGLSLDTTPMDMMQSILEGIAFRAAEVIRAMDSLVPIGQQISIDGGLSANPYFCQFLANVLDKEIVVQQFAELTAIGVALLACENSIALDLNKADIKRYQPKEDMSEPIKRFTEAIERSKHWK